MARPARCEIFAPREVAVVRADSLAALPVCQWEGEVELGAFFDGRVLCHRNPGPFGPDESGV